MAHGLEIDAAVLMPEPPPSAPKPHLSVSQLGVMANCGEAYRRRYVEGEKIPPSFPMLRGRAVHGGGEMNFRQKIDTREDMPADQIVDAAVAQFEAEARAGYVLTSEDRGRSLASIQGEATDEVAKLARLHAVSQAPDYQPVSIETAVRVVLPSKSHDLLTVIDLVDDRDRVIDFKTKRRATSPKDVEESLQFTAYAFARQVQTGNLPPSLVMETLVNTGGKQTRQKIATTRNSDDIAVLGARFDQAIRAKEAGIYQPAAIGAWNCQQAWCGYHSTCPFAAGRKGAQGD